MAMRVRNQGLLDLIAAALICMMLMSVNASEKSFALSQVTIKGAGLTFVFPLLSTWRVTYQKVLPQESPSWNQTIGASKSVTWPTGVGASGSEGVANTIKSSLNSIGYVELDYALTKGIPFALVKNPTGNFIAPSLDSTQEAVGNAVALNSLPAGDRSWTKVSMLKAPGPESYPIASFSYLILFKEMSTNPSLDQTKTKALVDFISWAITDGQKLAANLCYVPLPARVVKGDQDTLRLLTFKGTPLYTGP